MFDGVWFRVVFAFAMSVSAHGTFRGKGVLFKKASESAFGMLYFTPEAPKMVAETAHSMMLKFSLSFQHRDPTQLDPWDGRVLFEFYNRCKTAADCVAAARALLLEHGEQGKEGGKKRPDQFLCVCRGGRNRSKMAALLIALLLGDPPPDDLQEEDMKAMAHDLYKNPPAVDDARRLPPEGPQLPPARHRKRAR